MGGTVPPFPNTPSWRGAPLRGAQGQLPEVKYSNLRQKASLFGSTFMNTVAR